MDFDIQPVKQMDDMLQELRMKRHPKLLHAT